MDRPPPAEVPDLARSLVVEVDEILSAPRWILFRESPRVNHHAHAAASLRHVAALLTDIVYAAQRHREAAVRILGRAHLESWLIAMYIVVYGDSALNDIEASYLKNALSQRASLAQYDKTLRSHILTAKRRNRRIRARNLDKQRWNQAHPGEPPKVLTAEVLVPRRRPLDLDLAEDLADGDVATLSLTDVVARLNRYGIKEEGPDAVLDAVYDLGYRGLSMLGAHPTLAVIKAYLVFEEDRSRFVRTVPAMHGSSLGEDVMNKAVMLTAGLSMKVVGLKNDAAPVAEDIFARYSSGQIGR